MVAKTPLGSARIPPASECSCLLQTEQVDRRFIGPSLAQGRHAKHWSPPNSAPVDKPLEACSLVPGIRKKNGMFFIRLFHFNIWFI